MQACCETRSWNKRNTTGDLFLSTYLLIFLSFINIIYTLSKAVQEPPGSLWTIRAFELVTVQYSGYGSWGLVVVSTTSQVLPERSSSQLERVLAGSGWRTACSAKLGKKQEWRLRPGLNWDLAITMNN